ncbi:MAG: PD40 domain-containing protein [Vicinamibacteria bacterium]|nr:PD40 domain-containing protein [Vicinamibacteria bacterium]
MRTAGWTLVAVLVLSGHVLAGPYDPALRFLTHRTPHFQIHYHQGEEALAARLASIAEVTHVRLSSAWALPAKRMTHVVLVDQADLSNGSATVVPWNAIVIYPAPPGGAATIGNTDDWIEYVFTHEYAHILHLDRSRGWARLARGLLGRSAIAFPNLTLPLWQIEGLATLIESDDGAGRLHAGDFRELVDSSARAGRLEPLDRVNGGLVDWPSGQGWYAYGARFHQYLVRTYGPDRLRELSDRTAGRLPFLTAGAFRRVYGKSLGRLWQDFQAAATAEAAPGGSTATPMTRLGFLVDGPREAPDGAIYFTATDAHRFPGIYRLTHGAVVPERVVSRYGGEHVSVTARDVLFDQLEIVRGAALVSDLYLHDFASGRTRRLTREGRLAEADRSSDGARIVAVQVTAGARQIVVLDATALLGASRAVGPQALPVIARDPRADIVDATPRWSPDGRTIAVERRLRGGASTIVLVDGVTLREIASINAPVGGRVVHPAFSPDGTTLFFAASEGDRPFQLNAVDLGPGGRHTQPRLIVDAAGGARAPLPLRDGRMVFVGYTGAGDDLFEVDRVAVDQTAGDALQPDQPLQPAQPAQPAQPVQPTPYRPFPTFVPRSWLPVVENRDDRWRVGGAVVGVDVLARHVASASATWAVTTGATAADLAPTARPDWDAAYSYQRWQPAFYIAAQDQTSLFDAVTATGTRVPVAQREQTVDVGVWRPFRRVRWMQTALAAYHVERVTTDTPAASDARARAGVRTAWTFTSARRYGYSISQEDGVSMAVTGEFLRPGLGADGRSDALTADVRAYLPLGIPHAVLAARAAVAGSTGADDVQRRFRLGGSDGNPVAGAFGSDAVSLLRGFQDDVFVGDRVALMNLEARVPLLSVQRGWGTWPLFLRTVHAAAFTDIGHTWTGTARWADRKIGYGVELSADVVAGFGLPLTCTAGIGWGRDGAGTVPDAREIYFRVGRSF